MCEPESAFGGVLFYFIVFFFSREKCGSCFGAPKAHHFPPQTQPQTSARFESQLCFIRFKFQALGENIKRHIEIARDVEDLSFLVLP